MTPTNVNLHRKINECVSENGNAMNNLALKECLFNYKEVCANKADMFSPFDLTNLLSTQATKKKWKTRKHYKFYRCVTGEKVRKVTHEKLVDVTDRKESLQFLKCPISLTWCTDPVLFRGHLYEKKCIQSWLWKNNRDPATNEILKSQDISMVFLPQFRYLVLCLSQIKGKLLFHARRGNWKTIWALGYLLRSNVEDSLQSHTLSLSLKTLELYSLRQKALELYSFGKKYQPNSTAVLTLDDFLLCPFSSLPVNLFNQNGLSISREFLDVIKAEYFSIVSQTKRKPFALHEIQRYIWEYFIKKGNCIESFYYSGIEDQAITQKKLKITQREVQEDCSFSSINSTRLQSKLGSYQAYLDHLLNCKKDGAETFLFIHFFLQSRNIQRSDFFSEEEKCRPFSSRTVRKIRQRSSMILKMNLVEGFNQLYVLWNGGLQNETKDNNEFKFESNRLRSHLGLPFIAANLFGEDLSFMDLSNRDFESKSKNPLILEEYFFIHANLTNTKWTNVGFLNCWFWNCSFFASMFFDCTFKNCQGIDELMNQADLIDCQLL